MATKIQAFEYIVMRLIEWAKEFNKETESDALKSFSKLKLIKLHFFVSAVNANKDEEGLLTIFNNFYAMPYGHVESDVYKDLSKTVYYNIDRDCITIKDGINLDQISNIVDKDKIDSSIEKLKSINPELINYSAFDLVELSHRWYSWRLTFEEAKKQNKFSARIEPIKIQLEPKYFS